APAVRQVAGMHHQVQTVAGEDFRRRDPGAAEIERDIPAFDRVVRPGQGSGVAAFLQFVHQLPGMCVKPAWGVDNDGDRASRHQRNSRPEDCGARASTGTTDLDGRTVARTSVPSAARRMNRPNAERLEMKMPNMIKVLTFGSRTWPAREPRSLERWTRPATRHMPKHCSVRPMAPKSMNSSPNIVWYRPARGLASMMGGREKFPVRMSKA